MSEARQLNTPRLATVKADRRGTPVALGPAAVEGIREDWVIEDRWWTGRPLHRHYYELILANGRNVIVFRDLTTGRWYRQRS
jgi:hypothetical protein